MRVNIFNHFPFPTLRSICPPSVHRLSQKKHAILKISPLKPSHNINSSGEQLKVLKHFRTINNFDLIGICFRRWKLNTRLRYLTLMFNLVTILSLELTQLCFGENSQCNFYVATNCETVRDAEKKYFLLIARPLRP